jgi:hypothetical protein
MSGHIEMNSAAGTTVDTATVAFPDSQGRPAFTVDFIAQYEGATPSAPPRVVDVVITQLPPDDDAPHVSMQVNGEALMLVPRVRSRRAMVASIAFDDFVKLANADSVVERAFDAELEFGVGQIRMLRTVAQRWSGR